MHERQIIGAHGEEVAAQHLIEQGMQVLARNWRAALDGVRGELDVIALEDTTLVIVEVKTRQSTRSGGAISAVGWDKRRRLRRLAGLYLARNPHRGPVRGDVVTVQRGPDDDWTITHLRGVW